MQNQAFNRFLSELEGTRLPFGVYALSGEALHQKDAEDLPPALRFDGEFARIKGNLYAKTGDGLILALPERVPIAEAMLRLALALAHSLLGAQSEHDGKEDLLRQLLTKGLNAAGLDLLAAETGIDPQAECCTVLFQVSGDADAVAQALRETLGGTGGGRATCLGPDLVALLHPMSGMRQAELLEFAEAFALTAQEEAGSSFWAGIGEPRQGLAQARLSFDEARSALELGRVFRPQQSVFCYRNLLIERFMGEIPAAVAKRYHELLFNRRNSRVLNEEMMKTITTFFDCHLNISESARQLYIHRNTLVYRLDKVQASTGLDLRTFDNAIIFKLLFMLGKREETM
ncbi:MAG: helix-turn-helix domain-containing protein [Christensenellaceae bacterium]|nr:helix-turn-helix domain-containing protein [Christensenellaceae bacterium]